MPSKDTQKHYLEKELLDLLKTDSSIFEFIQNGSLDGVWYWDLEQPENEWMSPKFWTELGYDPKEMPHKVAAWQNIMYEDDLKASMESFQRHCDEPNCPYDQVVRFKHKDSSTVYIRCRGIVIRNKEGKPIRMLGAHNNITKSISLERELNARLTEYNQQLKAKNKELEQFTYITSHDLQEPLNTIIAFSRLLQESQKNLDPIGQKSVEAIVDSAHRMKDFIISLLEYSRIGRNTGKTAIHFPKLIEDLKIDLHGIISTKNATVEYTGISLELSGFKADIYKLFQNVIVNGIKYTDKDILPLITIHSEEQDNHYLFSIKDNGIGIDAEQYEKIFEMFQRLHPRDQYSGTGIGLSYCKKVVELHQGKIWLESEVGKGTTFYFTLAKQ